MAETARRADARETPQRTLARWPGMELHRYLCTAGPEDRPFTEQHGATTIALVRRGTFCYHVGGATHALYPGALLLGEEGAEYACSHEHGVGDECLSFSFEGDTVEEVLREALRAPGARSVTARRPFGAAMLPPVPRLAALLLLAEALAAGRPLALGLDEVGYLLAGTVVRELAGAPQAQAVSPRPAERDRALQAAAFIEAHHREPLSLATVARHVAMSPFHFLRVFRSHLGLTPHQHLLRARVRDAAARLLHSPAPVTDIAYDVGFGDLSNFSRTFSALVGCSPRRFRQGALPLPALARRGRPG